VVTDIDKKQKEKVQTIRYMVGDLDILIETATNPDIKKELLKLQEDIRYSDPMSTPETSKYDDQLKGLISMIEDTLSTPQADALVPNYISQARLTVKKRNNEIRISK
ncbi:MAG: hypothetical protein K5762_07405, partial [Bacilli bacterium]|nr:hypothetical protein [Bacilli bacterium]